MGSTQSTRGKSWEQHKRGGRSIFVKQKHKGSSEASWPKDKIGQRSHRRKEQSRSNLPPKKDTLKELQVKGTDERRGEDNEELKVPGPEVEEKGKKEEKEKKKKVKEKSNHAPAKRGKSREEKSKREKSRKSKSPRNKKTEKREGKKEEGRGKIEKRVAKPETRARPKNSEKREVKKREEVPSPKISKAREDEKPSKKEEPQPEMKKKERKDTDKDDRVVQEPPPVPPLSVDPEMGKISSEKRKSRNKYKSPHPSEVSYSYSYRGKSSIPSRPYYPPPPEENCAPCHPLLPAPCGYHPCPIRVVKPQNNCCWVQPNIKKKPGAVEYDSSGFPVTAEGSKSSKNSKSESTSSPSKSSSNSSSTKSPQGNCLKVGDVSDQGLMFNFKPKPCHKTELTITLDPIDEEPLNYAMDNDIPPLICSMAGPGLMIYNDNGNAVNNNNGSSYYGSNYSSSKYPYYPNESYYSNSTSNSNSFSN